MSHLPTGMLKMYFKQFRALPLDGAKTSMITISEKLPTIEGIVFAWTDKALLGNHITQNIIRQYCTHTGFFSSSKKNRQSYIEYIGEAPVAQEIPHAILIIGGGTTINKSLYLADSYKKQGSVIIIIPTNVLAIADVAIGSKGILDAYIEDVAGTAIVPQKNYFRKYVNPDFVYLNKDFLQSLSTEEIYNGLSECLKHGIMQDDELLRDVLIGYDSPKNIDKIYNVSIRTMERKAEVLNFDPFEQKGYGQILSYGHLHAHSLEKATLFSIPHGRAVIWGVLLDIILASSNIDFTTFKPCFKALRRHDIRLEDSEFIRLLLEAYKTDHKPFNFDKSGGFRSIAVTKIGQYRAPVELQFKSFDWANILNAWHDLQNRTSLQ